MELTCPSCLAKLQINDSKIPPQGAWAKCPRCREKFVVRPKGQGRSLLDDPSAAERQTPHNLNRPRTPEEERLLQRLAKNQPGPPPDDYDFAEMPVIYPESAGRLSPGCLLALILPAVVLSLVLLISLKAALHSAPDEEVVLPALGTDPPQPYVKEIYDRDMLSIRRNIDRNHYRPYTVIGVAPERRVLLYVLAQCETVPDLFILESIDIVPDGQKTTLAGITATFNYSGRLRKQIYLSFNEERSPSRCL